MPKNNRFFYLEDDLYCCVENSNVENQDEMLKNNAQKHKVLDVDFMNLIKKINSLYIAIIIKYLYYLFSCLLFLK